MAGSFGNQKGAVFNGTALMLLCLPNSSVRADDKVIDGFFGFRAEHKKKKGGHEARPSLSQIDRD